MAGDKPKTKIPVNTEPEPPTEEAPVLTEEKTPPEKTPPQKIKAVDVVTGKLDTDPASKKAAEDATADKADESAESPVVSEPASQPEPSDNLKPARPQKPQKALFIGGKAIRLHRPKFLKRLKRLRRPKRPKLISVILLIIAFACLGMAGKLLYTRLRHTTGHAPPPIATQTITTDTDNPEETKPKPSDFDTYTVPVDQPRRITLSTITEDGLVQRVGLTKDNAVGTPNNVNYAGWYTSSVKPGQEGLNIIDGHVSGKYNEGIFKRLNNLKTGDQFAVEFGDRSSKKFQVVSVKSYPENQAAPALFQKQDTIKQQLNLITCGGKFDRASQEYADRIVVVTKLIP